MESTPQGTSKFVENPEFKKVKSEIEEYEKALTKYKQRVEEYNKKVQAFNERVKSLKRITPEEYAKLEAERKELEKERRVLMLQQQFGELWRRELMRKVETTPVGWKVVEISTPVQKSFEIVKKGIPASGVKVEQKPQVWGEISGVQFGSIARKVEVSPGLPGKSTYIPTTAELSKGLVPPTQEEILRREIQRGGVPSYASPVIRTPAVTKTQEGKVFVNVPELGYEFTTSALVGVAATPVFAALPKTIQIGLGAYGTAQTITAAQKEIAEYGFPYQTLTQAAGFAVGAGVAHKISKSIFKPKPEYKVKIKVGEAKVYGIEQGLREKTTTAYTKSYYTTLKLSEKPIIKEVGASKLNVYMEKGIEKLGFKKRGFAQVGASRYALTVDLSTPSPQAYGYYEPLISYKQYTEAITPEFGIGMKKVGVSISRYYISSPETMPLRFRGKSRTPLSFETRTSGGLFQGLKVKLENIFSSKQLPKPYKVERVGGRTMITVPKGTEVQVTPIISSRISSPYFLSPPQIYIHAPQTSPPMIHQTITQKASLVLPTGREEGVKIIRPRISQVKLKNLRFKLMHPTVFGKIISRPPRVRKMSKIGKGVEVRIPQVRTTKIKSFKQLSLISPPRISPPLSVPGPSPSLPAIFRFKFPRQFTLKFPKGTRKILKLISLKRKYSYQPSLWGIDLGKVERSIKKIYTGFEIRGILVGGKRRRRRK